MDQFSILCTQSDKEPAPSINEGNVAASPNPVIAVGTDRENQLILR